MIFKQQEVQYGCLLWLRHEDLDFLNNIVRPFLFQIWSRLFMLRKNNYFVSSRIDFHDATVNSLHYRMSIIDSIIVAANLEKSIM